MTGLVLISLSVDLDCDFEESHLCGYSNQWNANVNWFVGGGGTQLFHNIPNDDTYNNKTGEYYSFKCVLIAARCCINSK